MLISTKGRYALRVMLELAQGEPGECMPLPVIAQRQGISEKYLESIIAVLARAGLVEGQRGKGGGYRLSRELKDYSVGEIVRLTEGSLAPVSCLEGENTCPRADKCLSLPVWEKLDALINDYLDSVSLADLLAERAQHIIDRFVAAMPHDTQEFLEKLPERPVEELYLITPEYLVPYLTYVKEHRRVFRTTVEQASALRMNDAYEALSRHVFLPILNRFGVSAADREYLMAFYISGLMAIINRWLQADCQDSIEHIISVMQACITRGAGQAKRASQ